MTTKVLLIVWAILCSTVTYGASSVNGNEGVVLIDGVTNVPVSSANPLAVSVSGGSGGVVSNVATWNGITVNLGAGNASTGTLRTVIASDQTPIGVMGTFWQATQPVSASSLPLPSGASTGAKQDTGNASLSSLDTKLSTINTTLGTPLQTGGNVVVTSIPVTHTIIDSGGNDFVASTGVISARNLNLLTGTATADSTVIMSGLKSPSTLSFRASPVDPEDDGFDGAFAVQVSYDNGSNWVYVPGGVYSPDTSTPLFSNPASSISYGDSSHYMYRADITGATDARITCSSYSSGRLSIIAKSISGGHISQDNLLKSIDQNGRIQASLSWLGAGNTGSVIAVNSGTASNGTQRVILASNGNHATNAGITGASSKTISDLNDQFELANGHLANIETYETNSLQEGGTITANAGTNLNTSLLALESGGNLASIKTDVDKIPSPGISSTSLSTPVVLAKDVITNCSGTITTGVTSQSLISANASDKSIEIYNVSSTEVLCFNYGATAALTDYCIPALGYYSNTINNQAIAVIATTTAHAFKCALRR